VRWAGEAKVPTGEVSVTAEIGLVKDATDGGFALTALLRVKLPEHLSINWAHFGLEGLGARHGPTCRAPARPPTSTFDTLFTTVGLRRVKVTPAGAIAVIEAQPAT
jgi:hypothetical protein